LEYAPQDSYSDGKRDDRNKLSEFIEIDEGFFETINTDNQKLIKAKRGRGSKRKLKFWS